MRLEKTKDKIVVWQTGSQNNKIEYDNTKDMAEYSRWRLSYVEDFLRSNKEVEEADKIKSFMGKTIKAKLVPQLIPTGNYRINQPIKYLMDTINRYIEEDDLDLSPDFQRAHVWTIEQRIAFVEFLLQGGKSNPIYFNHEGWMKDYRGKMVIVDGKQRLTSVMMFLNDEFPVFKTLDKKDSIGFYASEFDTFGFDSELIFVINNLPTRKQVLEWYLQMNKGNVAHTEEELLKVERLLEAETE